MAFIPAPNIVRVVVNWLLDEQILANVFHVDANATVTDVLIDAIMDVFQDWLGDFIVTALSEDISATGLEGKDLTAETGLLIERQFTTPFPGEVATPALPNNVALCITLFTDLAGRSYRGRSYMPGLGESQVVLSSIDVSQAAGYATKYVELVDALSTAGFELVVTSYQHNNVPRATAVSTPITAVGVNTVLDSQRRRLPGRGN